MLKVNMGAALDEEPGPDVGFRLLNNPVPGCAGDAVDNTVVVPAGEKIDGAGRDTCGVGLGVVAGVRTPEVAAGADGIDSEYHESVQEIATCPHVLTRGLFFL